MTLANRLTVLRVVLAAAVFLALLRRWPALALGLFLAAAVTDWLDGYLARRSGTVSPFGKVADPIADKILIIGTFIALLRDPQLRIPVWAVFVIIARELLIGGLRVIAGAQGKVLAAERGGKVKMVVQSIAVGAILLVVVLSDRGLAEPWMLRSAWPLSALCAALAVTSLWTYLRQNKALLEKSWS